MLTRCLHKKNRYKAALPVLALTVSLLAGCGSFSASGPAGGDEELIEYNGILKKKSELSEDTVRWLEWYQALPEEQQEALSFVPTEFLSENAVAETADSGKRSRESGARYREALTDEELFETAELVRLSYAEAGEAEVFEPVADDSPWYRNKGIEAEYSPGNIIIFRILTDENRQNGNGYLYVSVGRYSKSDPWKIINSGF